MKMPPPDKAKLEALPAVSVNAERLCALIDTAITVVDEETEALQAQKGAELARLSDRKGQALVGLSRWLQLRSPFEGQEFIRQRLEALRLSVERNQRVLQVQIEAVSHVAQMIMRAVEAERSDGTYCQPRPPYGEY